MILKKFKGFWRCGPNVNKRDIQYCGFILRFVHNVRFLVNISFTLCYIGWWITFCSTSSMHVKRLKWDKHEVWMRIGPSVTLAHWNQIDYGTRRTSSFLSLLVFFIRLSSQKVCCYKKKCPNAKAISNLPMYLHWMARFSLFTCLPGISIFGKIFSAIVQSVFCPNRWKVPPRLRWLRWTTLRKRARKFHGPKTT